MSLISLFKRIIRHADLFDAMLVRVGVKAAFAELDDGAKLLRSASNRCLACERADACEAWLDKHETADETPGFCLNHDLLKRLHDIREPSPSSSLH